MSSTMRFLSYLVTLLVTVFITACGGGGGSAGTVNPGSSDALRTDVPAGLTFVVSEARSFTIAGGKAPYSVISNREGIAVAGINGSTLTIGGVFPGTAELTVRDALGAKVLADVTITENGLALATTAPSSLTLAMGQTQSYPVAGGVGPYSVTSANSNIVSAVLVGQSVRLTGITPGGPVNVVIRDSLNATVSISVTVSPFTAGSLALFTTAPSALNVPIGTSQIYAIGGGVPFASVTTPYTVTSSNTGVATASLDGNTLTVRGVAVGTANVLIRDSVGTTITVAATVPSPTAVFTDAPATLTLGIASHADFTIGGGVPAYTVQSSDPATVTATKIGSNTVRVTGVKSGGPVTIRVSDSLGASTSFAVTVPAPSTVPLFTTAPSSGVTIAIGSSPSYTVGGGTAPYTVTSSNVSVATATPATIAADGGTLTINAIALGSASVVVRDSVGATVTIPVTVPATSSGTPLFTSAPSGGVIISLGSPQTYSVGGGSLSGYTATSSNTGVVTVSAIVSGNLTITPVAPGSATVVVRDSAGGTVSISVTVPSVNSQAFFTTAPPSVILAVGTPVTYTVGGGTSPYFVTSNNAAVANVSQPTATTYQITPVSAGSATIQIQDSAGGLLSVSVTVSASSSLSLSTTAPSTVTIAATQTQSYSVSGGSGTYTLTNTNPFNVSASISGSGPGGGTLTINGLLVGSSTLTVRDAAGAQVVITVNVIQPGSTLAVLPGSLSIDEKYTGQIDLNIFGGVAPYRGFTTDATRAKVTVVGSTLQVTTAGGSREICGGNEEVVLTVLDSQGASATSALTIVNSDADVCP
jgi:hypothetical protein